MSAAAASIIHGQVTPESVAHATEFVSRFTAAEFTAVQLRDDARDPLLDIRLHGDLTLLAEDLRDDAAFTIVAAMADLAQTCPNEVRALAMAEHCADLLGVTT